MMTPNEEKSPVLLVGNTRRSEFLSARAALDSLGQVVAFDDVESAAGALVTGGLAPELIVVAQAFPDQFSHHEIDRLRRLAPLAPVVALLGSWCEGETRTGRPWPAAIRTYWHQWPPRCHRHLARIRRGECSGWALPITATEEERLLAGTDERLPKRQGLVAIYTRAYEMEGWLSAACRSRGFSTVWLRPPRPALVEGTVAAIFDGSELRGGQFDELRGLSVALGRLPDGRPVPVIALLDFPRIEDTRRAAAIAAAVLSKPLELGDLFWQLDRVLEG